MVVLDDVSADGEVLEMGLSDVQMWAKRVEEFVWEHNALPQGLTVKRVS